MFDRSRLRTVSLAVLVGLCALTGVGQGYSGIEHAWREDYNRA